MSYTTIRSDAEEQIIPRGSTALAGAQNHVVAGVDHNGLISDSRVYQLVRAAVID